MSVCHSSCCWTLTTYSVLPRDYASLCPLTSSSLAFPVPVEPEPRLSLSDLFAVYYDWNWVKNPKRLENTVQPRCTLRYTYKQRQRAFDIRGLLQPLGLTWCSRCASLHSTHFFTAAQLASDFSECRTLQLGVGWEVPVWRLVGQFHEVFSASRIQWGWKYDAHVSNYLAADLRSDSGRGWDGTGFEASAAGDECLEARLVTGCA